MEILPAELHDLYRHLCDQIPPDYKEEATRYFQILAAIRNLASGELSRSMYLPSVLTLSLATMDDQTYCSRIVNDTENELAKQCEKTLARLRVCCGGFLEVGAIRYKSLWVEDDARMISRVKEDFDLNVYDGNESLVRFSHRSAREFLLEFTDLSRPFANDNRVDDWEPNLALSRAHIRRLQVLPWIPLLRLGFGLDEYYCSLRYLREFEKYSGLSSERTLMYLSTVGEKAAASLEPRVGLPWPPTWTVFAGLDYYAAYVGPAVDIVGVSALWSLKNTVRNCLAEVEPNPTYLLNCATSNILSRKNTQCYGSAIHQINEWKDISFGVCQMLLKAGR